MAERAALDFVRPLARGARDWPQRLALCCGERRLSYAELEAQAGALAARLAARGVGAGARLGLLMTREPHAAALVHAALALAAPLVLLNARLTAHELAPLLADAEPQLLLCSDALAPLAAEATRTARVPCLALRELLASAPGALRTRDELEPDADQAILFTSGTAGRPKGVPLTIANQWASARAAAEHLGLGERERWLACMPLYHVGGLALLLRASLAGGAAVLHERFDAGAVRRALAEEEITQVSLVPTMLARLLAEESGPARLPALRCALVGGAALDPGLAARASAAGYPLAATYGLTEAASQVATQRPGDDPAAGLPALPGVTLRIEPAPGAAVTGGAVGEICVRGPQVMRGYLGRPEASAAALAGGWLHTGDFGRLGPGGRLHVLERRTDLIVSGGENVYPSEIEALLLEHPEVLEAAVVGPRDPEWGQRVEAVLVCDPRGGRERLRAELQALCGERLAGFKRPRTLHFAASLPRTASGKLQRARVRSALETAPGPDLSASSRGPEAEP